MQHLRTSIVLMEVLWFTSYSRCCLLSGWADEFFFRISDLCCTLAYNSSSVSKSWLVLFSIKCERCSLVSSMRECERPEASTWSVCCQTSLASAANDLQCVWNSQRNGWFPCSGILVGCSPAGLAVLYSWGSTLGFLPPCIILDVSSEPGIWGWFTCGVFWLVLHIFSL